MSIYHALINTLSAYMIHMNLNMIFYTHVEHNPASNMYTYTRHMRQYRVDMYKLYNDVNNNNRLFHNLLPFQPLP